MTTNEELEDLYGPAAKFSDHQVGQTISFTDLESGLILTGCIIWVCAPGQTVNGQHLPTHYFVDANRGFPRVVFPGEVIEAGEM